MPNWWNTVKITAELGVPEGELNFFGANMVEQLSNILKDIPRYVRAGIAVTVASAQDTVERDLAFWYAKKHAQEEGRDWGVFKWQGVWCAAAGEDWPPYCPIHVFAGGTGESESQLVRDWGAQGR